MAINLKELSKQKEQFAPGHRACAGCGPATMLRMVSLAAGQNFVVSFATGCMEVVSTIYPYTAWRTSYIHNAFENSAATMSGVETAYRALKKRGRISDEFKFIAFGGDGGTYDIGLQSLSGAMERGHDMLYICYDNEGYMNTGIQRSGSTPLGAATSTSPAGKVVPGKTEHQKDLTAIMVAHHIPYVAQAAVHDYRDLMTKVQKALSIKGAKFLNVLAPCHRGWRIPTDQSIQFSKMAVETCFWPLFEVENGVYKLNYTPKEKLPLVEWIKDQGRFRHLFRDENKHILEELQRFTDRRWDELVKRCD